MYNKCMFRGYCQNLSPQSAIAPLLIKAVGNVLDHWEGVPNDLKDAIRDAGEGFEQAMDALEDAQANTPRTEIAPLGNGDYAWIKEACELLRAWYRSKDNNSSYEFKKRLVATDELLSGVPCPQDDLGFDSPADRKVRAQRAEERQTGGKDA